MAFILWPPVLGKVELMLLAIFDIAFEREILAEDGHDVPCPYEENSPSGHCGVWSLLEVIVGVHMRRFLLFFEQASRLAPGSCLPVVFAFFLGNPRRQRLIQIAGQRVNVRLVHAAQFGEAAVGLLAIAE